MPNSSPEWQVGGLRLAVETGKLKARKMPENSACTPTMALAFARLFDVGVRLHAARSVPRSGIVLGSSSVIDRYSEIWGQRTLVVKYKF